MVDKRELRLFNPFLISQADSIEIAKQYEILQDKLNDEADTPYQIADNIEIYANMNYLIGEMINITRREEITAYNGISSDRLSWKERFTAFFKGTLSGGSVKIVDKGDK